MEKEKQKIKEQSAYVWIDEYGNTKITMKLEDMFKIFSGKEIKIQVA